MHSVNTVNRMHGEMRSLNRGVNTNKGGAIAEARSRGTPEYGSTEVYRNRACTMEVTIDKKRQYTREHHRVLP